MKEKNLDHVERKQNLKRKQRRQKWEKPTLEDVSGKIMAQPYIRFT